MDHDSGDETTMSNNVPNEKNYCLKLGIENDTGLENHKLARKKL